MIKKIVALFLAVGLLLCSASCTTDKPNDEESDSSSESASESASESKTESDTETESDNGVEAGPDTSELLPVYEGAQADISFTDTYNDCTLMTVQGTTKAEYEAYVAKLSAYTNYTTVVATRNMLGTTGNLASMYTKETENGTYLINALWIPAENSIYGVNEVKVTAEPLGGIDLSVFDPASATLGEVQPLLIQIGPDDVGAVGSKVDGARDQNAYSAMSYAYRLSDGSFVVLDGGGDGFGTGTRDKDQAARVYHTLEAYSSSDEIVIAAWYFTHPHTDHMGGFMAFTDTYLNNSNYRVTLESVICNLPNIEEQTNPVPEGAAHALSADKIALYNARLEELRAQGVKIYKAHVGQTYYIRNLTVEILFTYDLLSPALPVSLFVSDAYGAYAERIYNNDEVSFTVTAWSQKDLQYQALDAIYKGKMPAPNADGSYTLTIPAGYTYTAPDETHTYTATSDVSFTFKKDSAEYLYFANYDKKNDVAIQRERYVDAKDSTKAVYRAYVRNNFTNSFSIIAQMTLKVDGDTSYTAMWTGDATCYSITTVNRMYGTAMKSDFVQVMHHGLTQMDRGTSDNELLKYFFENEINLFFGAAAGVSQSQYSMTKFPQDYNSDGSYGYVRAKYVLWPSYLKQAVPYVDGEPGDDIYSSDSRLSTWNPLNHLQLEAKAQGGDVYVSRCFLTVFALGESVTVTEDHSVLITPMPDPISGGAISSVEDFASMKESGTYYLTGDITVTDPEAALYAKTFAGTLDGRGHTITIVYDKLDATAFDGGSGFVFANLKNATVKNLTVTGARMAMGATSSQFGILACRVSGTVVIENVHVKNAKLTEYDSPNTNIGGFFGDTAKDVTLTIKDSGFEGEIDTAHTVGGLIGRVGSSSAAVKSITVENCTVKGTLSSTGSQIGGFFGMLRAQTAVIKNCECRASVQGSKLAGGFIGSVKEGTPTLDGCKLTGSVTGETAGDWVASGTVTTVNCSKG